MLAARIAALQDAHLAFAQEQRRAIIELKGLIRANAEGRAGHADLPRKPLENIMQLCSFCDDLRRIPGLHKALVKINKTYIDYIYIYIKRESFLLGWKIYM